jgi:hypothetical protein
VFVSESNLCLARQYKVCANSTGSFLLLYSTLHLWQLPHRISDFDARHLNEIFSTGLIGFLYSLEQLKCLYKEHGLYENSPITKRYRLQEEFIISCLALKVSNESKIDNQADVVGRY